MSEIKSFGYGNEIIPPMNDPLGKYWDQPDSKNMIIGEKYAVMSMATLLQLKDYSRSQPSGVYPGKMWRTRTFDAGKEFHYLRWFGISEDPKKCTNNIRSVIIL